LGIFAALAFKIAVLKRGLLSGIPPPILAEIEISFISFVNILPRFASAAPFACFIVAHLLCPDMTSPCIYNEKELTIII
jgi:hypothetical protein